VKSPAIRRLPEPARRTERRDIHRRQEDQQADDPRTEGLSSFAHSHDSIRGGVEAGSGMSGMTT
jgi:hypothetical protein